MYANMRTYRGVERAEEVVARVERGLVPLLRARPGFVSYHLFQARGQITSVTVFATEEGARGSVRLAAAWARENLADLHVGEPEITGGETFLALADD